MTFVVVHESMFGNTRMVADTIADTLRAAGDDVRQVPAARLPHLEFADDDVLVLGAPTHAHTFPGHRSRLAASGMVEKSKPPLTLEPTATAPGIREWIRDGSVFPECAAVFDTRANGPRLLTGSAAVRIARQLRRRQVRILVPPASFLVSANRLVDGELDRAAAWARTVLAARSPSDAALARR